MVTQTVAVADQACLTVDPGVHIRFHPDCALSVGDGTLVARGTEASNLLFTAHLEPPEDNRWDCIHLGSNATDASYDAGGVYTNGSIIEYASVQFANGTGAIHADGSSPYVHQCLLSSNNCPGVYAWNAFGMVVHGNTVCRNLGNYPAPGLHFDSSDQVTVSSNMVFENGLRGIGIWRSVGAVVSGNSVFSHAEIGVEVYKSEGAWLLSNNVHNSFVGVYIGGESSSNAVVQHNMISNNSFAGLFVEYSASPVVESNTQAAHHGKAQSTRRTPPPSSSIVLSGVIGMAACTRPAPSACGFSTAALSRM